MFPAALRRHITHGTFQDFQESLLDAFSANVARNGWIFRFPGYFIDFININNTAFCPLNIKICCLNQAEQDVFYIFAHITSFCQRCSVRNGKRNVQQTRKCLRQQRFTHTCRTKQKHIALIDFYVVLAVINTFIMVVYGHRKSNFCIVLADDIFIQLLLNFLGFQKNRSRLVVTPFAIGNIGLVFQNRHTKLNTFITDINPRPGD